MGNDDSDPRQPDGTSDQDSAAPNTTPLPQGVPPQPTEPAVVNAASGIVVEPTKEASIKAAKTSDAKQPSQKDILDRIKTSERWMIFFTAIVAFSTVAQVIQSACNNRSTSKQVNKIIAAANTQACAARKIARASQRNAAAAESFSTSAQGIETKTGEAVTQFQHLARATQQAADVAREALISVQAALVAFAGTMSYVKRIDDNKISSLTLSLPLPNVGGTSTVNARSQVNIKPFPITGMPTDFTFPDLGPVQMRQGEIPARATGNATIEGIRPEIFVDAEHNRSRIYLWGWITYNDVFKGTPRHLTEFCDEVSNIKVTNEDALQAPQASSEFSWILSFCLVSHNCYDRQCSDYSEKIKE